MLALQRPLRFGRGWRAQRDGGRNRGAAKPSASPRACHWF